MIAEKLRDLSQWTTDDGQDLVMVADVLELIREDFEVMRQEIEQAKIGCEQPVKNGLDYALTIIKKQMRPATPEERQGEKEYIDSISEPTGVNFNDLLKYDEEWIDECFDKLYNAPTVEDKPQTEWIPVSEQPKKDGKYLVTLHFITHDAVETAKYSNNLHKVDEFDFPENKAGWYNYDSEYGYYEQDSIIAWMPLPKPYEPQERSREE